MDDEQAIHYACPQSLLVSGPEALHEDDASRVEKALGRALPHMEVRVAHLSLTVRANTDATHELPTVGNTLTKAVGGLARKKTAQHVDKPILHKVHAHFQPGTMTLVLGQPGSGKSALLKVLSGRFPLTKTTTLEGEITYNGVSRDEMTKRLPQFVSYVPQRDRHYPTLTVKETLEFAHACCGGELSARDEQHFTKGSAEENKEALETAGTMNTGTTWRSWSSNSGSSTARTRSWATP